jgi:hypothetical protein
LIESARIIQKPSNRCRHRKAWFLVFSVEKIHEQPAVFILSVEKEWLKAYRTTVIIDKNFKKEGFL